MTGPNRGMLAIVFAAALALSLACMYTVDRGLSHYSLFDLTNLVGPTVQSLLHGGGMTACTETMGTPGNPICYHAGRMPMASTVVAAGVQLFGDRFVRVDLFKTLLFLTPILASMFLAWQWLPSSPVRRALTILLLLAPFGMTAFLADVVNIQVEEGYSYSLLALAFALLIFPMPVFPLPDRPDIRWRRAILFALCADGTYLAKSSMVALLAVFALSYLLVERRTSLRILVFSIIGLAPAGWAIHQHHASGRYTMGTSLDGFNLHKANNPGFLARYPAPPGIALDMFDSELNRGHSFPDEWSFDDYHRKAAAAFILTHPRATLVADLRKLAVIFFAIRKNGSEGSHFAMPWMEEIGLLLFRLIFWTALAISVFTLARRRPGPEVEPREHHQVPLRSCSIIFSAVVLAAALPYLVGFAYTRHISVLIYPSVLFCCRCLRDTSTIALDSKNGVG